MTARGDGEPALPESAGVATGLQLDRAEPPAADVDASAALAHIRRQCFGNHLTAIVIH